MSIECDVLVVGAGPAGLTSAQFLSKKGFKTIILEKNKKLGGNNTKFDITEGNRISKILKELDIKPNKTSNRSEWISQNNSFILDSEIQDFYFKRGPEENSIENILFTKLNNKNVEIIFGSEVDSIKSDGKNVESVFSRELEILPKYIIVADGGRSKFEQTLNINSKIFAKIIGLGIVLNSNKEEMIPHAKIYFDEKVAPGGYIYSGSVNKESFFCVVIDDLFSDNINLKKNLDNFMKTKIGEVDIKNYFKGYGFSGVRDTIRGNVLFIGGSAFFHDPFLGYGLNYAIESAYFATNAILNKNTDIYKGYSQNIQEEIKNLSFARETWREADTVFFNKLIQHLKGETTPHDNRIDKIVDLFL